VSTQLEVEETKDQRQESTPMKDADMLEACIHGDASIPFFLLLFGREKAKIPLKTVTTQQWRQSQGGKVFH